MIQFISNRPACFPKDEKYDKFKKFWAMKGDWDCFGIIMLVVGFWSGWYNRHDGGRGKCSKDISRAGKWIYGSCVFVLFVLVNGGAYMFSKETKEEKDMPVATCAAVSGPRAQPSPAEVNARPKPLQREGMHYAGQQPIITVLQIKTAPVHLNAVPAQEEEIKHVPELVADVQKLES